MNYSWSTYKTTLKITDQNLKRAEELSHEVDEILEGLGLKHVKKKFNKHYVSYKNKSKNVLTIEFCHDTTPGVGFHIPKNPSKSGMNLPKNVLDNGEWYPKDKQFFVPIIYLKVKIADLKPLFIEAKRYRG